MNTRSVTVCIDNRIRLMSAVLAATTWPAYEQQRRRHRAHVHARNTQRCVQPYEQHPAVIMLQTLLNRGVPLEAIYTAALTLSWPDLELSVRLPWTPPDWPAQLRDFLSRTDLQAWWHEERATWELAREQIDRITDGIDFCDFFVPFVGPINERFVLMPNVSYPSDAEVGMRLNSTLFCLAPPRIAWGDNEPWPFDEDAAHIIRGALSQYARLLMASYLRQHAAAIAPATSVPLPVSDAFRQRYPTWGDQFTALFSAAAVAIFLEQMIGQPEAKAYLLMEHKVNGLRILPGVVNVLKRYMAEHDEGRYNELADYLPDFGKTLRVVKRTISH